MRRGNPDNQPTPAKAILDFLANNPDHLQNFLENKLSTPANEVISLSMGTAMAKGSGPVFEARERVIEVTSQVEAKLRREHGKHVNSLQQKLQNGEKF